MQPRNTLISISADSMKTPPNEGRNMSILNQRDTLSGRFVITRSENLEDKLRKWAKPPSDTEIEKCDRVVRMVKAAIDADKKLQTLDLEVYAKGSYANRTNIPADSDVDVAVLIKPLYFNDYPENTTAADFGFVSATYTYQDFKRDVASAIVNYFGADQVQVGDKAIKIHSNTVRVDADVVAHTVHRRFSADRKFVEGVALVTKEGKTVYNWPQQDYDNGVSKNERTSKRYKAVVRILKNLRGEMLENGYSKAEKARSYLIACLAWNVPDYFFEEESYTKMIEDCLSYLVERTSALENVNEWGEVNELKYLFRPQQGWKFDEVHDFLVEALSYFRKLK